MSTKQEIINAFHYRFACKVFDTTKNISDEDFEFILETGRLSPSSFGLEPWKILVVENKTLRQEIMPLAWGAQTQLPTADKFLIILSRKKESLLPESDYIQNQVNHVLEMPAEVAEAYTAHFGNFLKNDFDLLVDDRRVFDWASRQAYLAMANMMTSAAAIGIDSCPIEGFDMKAVEQLLADKNVINSEEFGVSAMLAFGYRANPPSRDKKRQSLETLIETIY
ncbi:Oxygen-insensitive NAD(P)H nitroreductase [Listeria weihenstephanensis FSL R9-0317]|uniref:NAD(P)H nitroreductase YfkO n=1 Tax=Listeria weihenstephanensis TaxID=1006155 RepID=A0A1S7FVG3_9LIST|nr:NAD(P)H-dependent oxidoreductase [Listeria weihenstephanensis]AQY51428.1 NAD(P)H nitroreductase YfkO [Listeria weihenstephanensis]EUJ35776.1 Oxygen-insensitive NAD(P)H nitroreductase [Listeria weihenstephanensis FSL R9-0317]